MFNLPLSTEFNKIIPKSAFDKVTNTKQKKQFVDHIERIKWINKLSPQTINLSGKEVVEIQIFEILLKEKEAIVDLLDVIDKTIPYHIIFILKYGGEVLLSASQKHPHPTNIGVSVIDWRFNSTWITEEAIPCPYRLNLKQSLDYVFSDICTQLSGKMVNTIQGITGLIEQERRIKVLESSISKLQSALKRTKQFNIKVKLNLELQEKKAELKKIIGN